MLRRTKIKTLGIRKVKAIISMLSHFKCGNYVKLNNFKINIHEKNHV